MRITYVIILFLFFLSSCTSEFQRIDLLQHNGEPVEVNCQKHRQIDFYLDCDMEFSELPEMVMDFEFYRGEEQILKGGLNPLAAKPMEREIKTIKEKITHWKFYGKLEGNFIPQSDTLFTIKPTLIKNYHPNLKINKFDLVFVR